MPNRNGKGQIGGSVRLGVRKQGNKECTCPACGYKESHTRGIPCTQKKCPKCGTPMKGIFCS
ncbi:MAG: hypothetical protein RBS01_02060 [Candidatus Dojkabacteria bacterium]|jgi:hypothetical protein|nr:hypothetical protein [Candidatus Dojkabacteria bacterium]